MAQCIMEQKAHLRDFIRYTVFSVLGTLGVSCYILADTFFISKGMGTKGLAALNLALPVYNFIHGSGLMLGMGGATKFSVCSSQGKRAEGDRVYTDTVCLAVVLSVCFVLVGMFLSKLIAILLGAKDDVLEMTVTYLQWLLLFAPAFLFNDVFLCFVRNDNSPQLSMVAMLVGSFANIILDYWFIFPMRLGILGAILATGVSPLISMAIMLPHWICRKNTFHIVREKMQAAMVWQVISLGFPSLVAQVSSGIVMIVLNVILLGLEGNTGVAAYGVVANLSFVTIAIYTGIAQGIQPLFSRFHGENDAKQMRLALQYAIITVLLTSCVIYSILFLFAEPITAAFNSDNNLALQRIAVPGLKWYFTSVFFVGCNLVLAVFFTSVEKAFPAHVLSILRGFLLILPITLLFTFFWGILGIWIAYPVTELLVALLGLLLYQKNKGNLYQDML